MKVVFELASRNPGERVEIQNIAEAQGISHRFLESILSELKHGGFVESRRGSEGYMLTRDAKELTVGEVFEYIQDTISAAPDSTGKRKKARFFRERIHLSSYGRKLTERCLKFMIVKPLSILLSLNGIEETRVSPITSLSRIASFLQMLYFLLISGVRPSLKDNYCITEETDSRFDKDTRRRLMN